jgi:hypothetical protein
MNSLILKEIYRTLVLCKLSNLNQSEINNINTNDIFYSSIYKIIINNNMNIIQNDELKCYMYQYNNIIFIILNSKINYTKKMIKLKDNIRINSDIFQQYSLIYDKILDNISEYTKEKSIKKIFVCGYKIGGSLGTVISAILAERFKNMYLVSCYTFGALKVGNKHFCKYFNDNITSNYRIHLHYDDDISNNWNNYRHVSNYLEPDNENIIEKPQIIYKKSLFCCISPNIHDTRDNIIPIDMYIDKINSIIIAYNINIKQENKDKQLIPYSNICFVKKNDNDESSTLSTYTSQSMQSLPISRKTSKNNSPIIDDLSQLIIKKLQNMDDIITNIINTKKRSDVKNKMEIKDIVLQFVL